MDRQRTVFYKVILSLAKFIFWIEKISKNVTHNVQKMVTTVLFSNIAHEMAQLIEYIYFKKAVHKFSSQKLVLYISSTKV